MILHSLTHHGTHAFPASIQVDFAALPTLLAIQGPNGAGKTTLMDLVAGALYLTFPYRPGALHRHFVAKGVIDLTWSCDGDHYRSRVMIDPVSERTEATLTRDETVLAGPLVRDYKAAVEKIVGPLDLFLASAYAVQNQTGAFLHAARADRKALLTELLGLGRFPRWHETAKAKRDAVDREVVALRTRITDLEATVAKGADLEEQRIDLVVTRAGAEQTLTSVQEAMRIAQGALSAAREAQAALTPLHSELRALEADLATLTTRKTDAAGRRERNANLLTREPEIKAARDRAHAIRNRLTVLNAEIEDGRRLLHARQQAAQEARHAVTTAQNVLATVQRDRQRLERQGGLLATVPCAGEGPYAGCPLLKDARAATDALPATRAEEEAAERRLETARTVTVDVTDPCAALVDEQTKLTTELDALAEPLGLVGHLDAAQDRITELDEQLASIDVDVTAKTARHTEIRERLATLPGLETEEREAAHAVAKAEREAREAQQALTAAERDLGAVDAQLRAVDEATDALAVATAAAAALDADLADWSLIVRFLGPTGVPTLLIDRALPEISKLATELLRECYGSSVFDIQLTTQREGTDGRLLETLDVVVRRGGEPVDAALLSGGESVLVSEALSLAIALYQAGRSGRRMRTLLRDEVSAPLDVDRAPAYTRMLRRAASIGDFDKVLFVSHQPACLELADAVLVVKEGTVKVA